MAIDIQSIWNNAVAQTQALNPERLRVNYDDVNAASADRQMQAIQANVQENPNAIKAQSVLNAAERKRKALGLQHEQNQAEDTALRLAGRTEEEVQANASKRSILQNMNEVERTENYQRYKANDPSAIPDTYLEHDMNQLDDMELEARYGKTVADMKRASTQNIIGLSQQATQQNMHSGLDSSWYNPRNVIGSLVTGTGNTLDSTGDAVDAMRGLSSGNIEQAYANMNAEGIGSSMAKTGSDMLGSDYQAENERAKALEQLDNIVVDQLAQQKTTYGTEEDLARKEANNEVDSNALDRLANANQLYQQGLQQAPEFLAGAGVGSLVRKGATVGTKKVATEIIKDTAEMRAKQEAAKFAKGSIARTMASKEAKEKAEDIAKNSVTKTTDDILKAKANTRAEVVKDELTNKATELYKKNADKQATKIAEKAGDVGATVGLGTYYGAREGAGAASEAYEQIKRMNQDYVVNSPEGEKLQKQHPDWTKEQIHEEIAQNAGSIAGMRQGATSFVSGAILSGAEKRVGGLGRGSNLKQSTANYAKSTTGEMGQEYTEEYGGTYNPRVAINQALGKEHYKESTGDLTAKAHVRGVSGAATAGLTTGVTNAHEIIPAIGKAVKNQVEKKRQSTQEQVYAKDNETVKSASVKSDGSKTNFGTAVEESTNDLQDVVNQSENQDTAFGKAVKEGNTAKIVAEFQKEAQAAQARIDSGKSDNIDNDKQIIESYNNYRDKLTQAIGDDADAGIKDLGTKYQAVMQALRTDTDIRSKFEENPNEHAVFNEDGSFNEELTLKGLAEKIGSKHADTYKALSEQANKLAEAQSLLDTEVVRTLMSEVTSAKDIDTSKADADINIGKTGKATEPMSKTLSRISKEIKDQSAQLSKLDKNSDEYKTRVKDFEANVNNLIGSMNTRGSLEASEARQAWSDVSNYLGSLRDTIKQHNVNVSGYLTELHSTIAKMQQEVMNNPNISETQAKVLFDKFIGSRGKKGLLTYVQEAMANGGKLSAKSRIQLAHFLATQQSKNLQLGVIQQLVGKVSDDKFVPFKFKNPELIQSKVTRKQNTAEGDVRFTKASEFNNYVKASAFETDVFSKLAEQLLSGANPSFNPAAKSQSNASETSTVASTEPSNTNTQVQEENVVESQSDTETEPEINESVAIEQIEGTEQDEEASVIREVDTDMHTETESTDIPVEESFVQFEPVNTDTTEDTVEDADIDVEESVVDDEASYKDATEEEFDATKEVAEDKLTPTQRHLKNNSDTEVKSILDRLWRRGKKETPLENDIPLLAHWRSIGIVYGKNVFAKAKFKARNVLSTAKLHAAKVAPKGSAKVKAYADLLGMTEEELKAMTSEEKYNTTNFLTGYIELQDKMSQYFKGVLEVNKQAKKELTDLQVKLRATALINFTQKDSQGNYGFTSDFTQAMANAIIKTFQETGTRVPKPQQALESLQRDDATAQVIFMNGMLGLKDDEVKNKFLAGNTRTNTLEASVVGLGTNKEKFIEDLGRNALNQLGIVLNPADTNINQGIVNTLGVELYNSMLEMGVLDVQRVQYVTNNGEPVEYIDHVNFIWNNGFKFRTDTKENREKYREMWRNNSRVNQNKASNFTDNANVNMFAQIKAGLGAVAYTRLFPETKHSYNGVKAGTGTETTPFKVTNDDIQTPLTSGSNSEAKSYVQALNNIKYKVNMPFYELVVNGLGNIAEIALGKRDVANMVAIDKVIEAQESRNSQIDRSFDVLHHYTSQFALDGKLADAWFHLKHKIMSNGRIHFVTDLNPQSDKFIREMIYGETSHGATTFKPNKPMNEFLSGLNNSDNTHELGYALALAQALGVKIERVYDQEAFAKLKDILEGKDSEIGTVFNDMVQLIKDTQENGSPSVGSELIADAFYKVFGNGAARALHAAMTVANYDKAVNTGSNFVSNLMIEADGIGNGVHNSLRQFAIGFTPAYIHSLKRTGIVTMDLAYKAQLQDKKDLSMIEGAKHIFRKNKENPNDNIADVYQVVSNQITKQVRMISEGFINDLAVRMLKLNSIDDVINSKVVRMYGTNEWAKRNESPDAPADGFDGFFTNKEASALTRELLANARSIKLLGAMVAMDTDISKYSFNELISANFAKNVSLAVKRNFAKAGVTPTNYGGKLDGITNQISSDLNKTLDKLANYAFILASDPEASNESIRTAYDKFMDFVDIFHEMPRLEKATRTEYQKAINNVVNNFYTKDKYGNGAITVLKESLGSLMEKAINTVYAEQFDAIDFAISADNALYSEFILEFNEAYETAIRRRNESKGYASYKNNGEMTPIDPRYLDPLNKKEIKDILANMHTSPVIATAMSNNAQVINQLFNVGNSLIKVGKRDNTQNKRVVYTGQTSDMAINSAGFNIQLGSTIRDMMRHFDPAGAAALTQSIVPTESTTQGKLAVELAKDGMLVLDVFDGAEMMPHLRELIGNKINEITNNVHLDNSLLEAFFHKLNRSNLGERIKAIPEDIINDFVAKTNRSGSKVDFVPSRELVNLIEIYATTEQASALDMKLKLSSKTALTYAEREQLKTAEAQLRAVKALRGVGNQVREAVLSGQKRVSVRASVLINLGLHTNVKRLNQEFLTYSYDNYLRKMMMYAAQNRAIKYIEKNFLLAVISQFGGVSNGYAHLKESKQAQAVLERFKAYVGKIENTGGIPFDEVSLRDENGSKILSNFLNTDPELTQVMKYQVNIWANKLAPNYVGRANNVSGGFKTVKEFLDTVLNQDAKSLGIDPTLQKTIRALATPIRNIVKENTKIYSDKAEYERITGQPIQGAGAYNYNVLDNGDVEHLIYVDPNQENIVTTFHEINHGIQNFIFDSYILNPEGLDKEIVQGMDVLKKIAIDMASLYQNNPDVMNLLNEANQLSQFDVNTAIDKSNALLGNMANITYVFSREAAKNLSPKDLATAQIHALKEFYAYGLSQPEILNRMRYNGIRNRKEGLFGLIDKLIKLFQTMRNRVAQAFGYTDRQEAPDSFLIDALSAINAIEHRLGKVGGIHSVRPNEMSTKTLSRVAPKNHLLFQVAGLTANTTNKTASEVFKDIVDTSPNISKEHGQYLQSLFDSVNQAIVDKSNGKVPFATNYAQAWDMIRDNDLAQDANNIVRDLAQVGITLNDAEKTAFKLMYAVNKVNFDNGNNQLLMEAEQFVQGIMQNIDPSKFLHQGQIVYNGTDKFNAIFNNTDGSDQLALVVALANTNEEFRNYLNQAVNNQGQTKGIKKFGKKLKEAFNNVTLNSSASKYIDNIKDYSVIDQLGLVSASLDFNTKASAEARIQQQRELDKADQKQREAANFVNDFADGLSSKTASNLIKGIGGFVLSGQMRDKTDADSTFRQMVQDVVNNKEYLAGRPTFYSTIYRWFMGAYEATQYAYKLRSQFAVMSDAVREKVGNAITATVEKDFKDLTDTKRNAIAKAVNPTRLHTLDNLTGNLKVNIVDILSNPRTHSAEISAFKQELDARVRNLFSNENTRTQDQIINYLNWQVAGLGELMVRGVAKGSKNTTHGILPNVKAIGALVQFKQGVKNLPDLNANQQQELNDVLQGLSSLYALNYVSDADKATLVDMFKTERKGMASLFAELTDMDNNADKVDPDSLLGFDGYSHNKRNPNQEIQILDNPTEAEIQELNFLGWEHSLTLPNGEKVFTTQNSLHNNWTAGSFGNAELSVRGANSVTGRSLRSTGALVDSKAQLGKELQQRLHKIVNTPDYYNTLTEDSHYKPVINRFASITGYEVDVSNEQRDMFIESTENDIAAIGNYQARLVEEGIIAKNNEDNIKVLNQVYQQSRDKKLFTRIDGQAKPRSNKPSDVQYAQRLNDFYYSLPAQTRALIDSQDGLMVHTHEVDNLIGYYQASTADIFTGTSGLPEPVQKAFIGVMREFYKISGVKSPAVLLRQTGRFTGEFASLTKDFILNRSMVVPAQNMLSNVLQLVTAGVPVNKVVPLMIEGYRNAKAYTTNQSKIISIEHQLATRKLSLPEQAKLKAEIKMLEQANSRNPAKVLVQNGILTSVTDLSITNDKEDNQFSMFNQLSKKVGLDKVQSAVPQDVKEVLIQDGTKMHNTMMQLMDYGDFTAKYALYQHMVNTRGLESEHAINVIRDEFVDYAMNRGREFDWMNKVGLTWFLSYKLAIQKIFFRNLRRNALRTMAVWGSARAAGAAVADVPLIRDVIGETVMDQTYAIKHSLYHLTPQHDSILDSHWIHKVLEAF